jgi:hypothetical protein
MVAQLDALVTQEANFIAGEARQGRLEAFQERLRQDPRRVKPTELFDAEGNRLAGNIESLPSGLHVDGAPQDTSVVRIGSFGREEERGRATARRLPNGKTLVVAWSTNYNEQTAEVVKRGLIFGLLPGFGLALLAIAPPMMAPANTPGPTPQPPKPLWPQPPPCQPPPPKPWPPKPPKPRAEAPVGDRPIKTTANRAISVFRIVVTPHNRSLPAL